MKISTKTKKQMLTILISAILTLSIAAMMSTSKAQTGNTLPTYAFLAASPNPAGIGQTVTIEVWLGEVNPTALISGGGRWQGYTVLITKPDKTTQTLGPFTANDASFAVTTFTPGETGNYTLFFSFPGQHVTGFGLAGPVNTYYSSSNFTTTLTVEQQPATTTPQAPLPTIYWTRPVNSQNSFWYTISGNWLAFGASTFGATNYNETGNFDPYTTGPSTAHILWTKPLLFGGLIGGEFGGGDTSNYYTGKTYQPQFTPPVIINGVLYYNSPTAPYEGFYAVDLRTGQTLWFENTTTYTGVYEASQTGIFLGQVYNYVTPNQEGGIPYLWGVSATPNEWIMYDANTGNPILKVSNVPTSGINAFSNYVEGQNGELLAYFLGNNWLAMWNSSLCIQTASTALTGNVWEFYPPIGATLDFSTGIQWNVTTPNHPGQIISQVNSGIVLATTGGANVIGLFTPMPSQLDIGYDAMTGQQLWVQNRTYPSGPATGYDYMMGPMADGVFTEYNAFAEQWYGFSTATGKQLWVSPADTDPWGEEANLQRSTIAYGMLYGSTADGINAYNLTTGQLIWRFHGSNSGTDFPGFASYPFEWAANTVADGKIYAQTGVSHGDPLFRGAQLYCINATTGQLIWNINDFGNGETMPIADGILVTHNMYDNQIYAYGMGPSKTTASAQAFGSSVVISGSVTDISAGSKQQAVAANFPNGLPCVSDASMTQFMEAVYMQQPMPTNVTGVPVTISVTDSNHNCYVIGTTTTDASGTYSLTWTPIIPGNFTVTATFAGTQSYYGSSAETHFYASPPSPTASPYPSPVTGLASTASLELGIAAVIIVIIIIGAILVILTVRKRP